MLVLTRKKHDSIVIDGRILVEVLQVKGNGIRLGITAPPDVSILRGELKPFGVAGSDEPPQSPPRQQSLSFYESCSDEGVHLESPESSPEYGAEDSLGPLHHHARFTRASNRWKIR